MDEREMLCTFMTSVVYIVGLKYRTLGLALQVGHCQAWHQTGLLDMCINS